MTKAEFFVTPGFGEAMRTSMHYSQSVRIGDRVETAGQPGWDENHVFPDSLADEIRFAFDNVERALTAAGARWSDVIAITSYHVPETDNYIGDTHAQVMVEQMRTRMGNRAPIWTELGVSALGEPSMRVEIRVSAVIEDTSL